MKFLLILLAALVAFFFAFMTPQGSVLHDPGVLVTDEPLQTATDADPFEHAGYRLKPLADFRLKARVLSRSDYRFDREADLAPLDLALGWGPMSDSEVLDQIEISQRNRFFFWRVDSFPIPRRDIEHNAANMHLIPADEAVAVVLDRVQTGHVVTLQGRLVEASAPDGWRWRSSLTRTDTGKGACELFYVESAQYE